MLKTLAVKENNNMRSKSPFKQDKCSAAWDKFKSGYTGRKNKETLKKVDGKYKKVKVPISAEENLAEYNREKNEFECVNGKIQMKKTDDAERPIKD